MENKNKDNVTEEGKEAGEMPVDTEENKASETPEMTYVAGRSGLDTIRHAYETAGGQGTPLDPPDAEVRIQTEEIPDPMQILEAKLVETEAALKIANDRYLRTVAELENFKKRTARETGEFRKYATSALVQKLLPALDNMERAVDSAGTGDTGTTAIFDGLRITLADILKVFGEFNVKSVEAEGKLFDPVYHMAVAHEETDTADPDTVIRVFQKGYIMHDRLLRPAMVSVAKAKTVPVEKDDNSVAE